MDIFEAITSDHDKVKHLFEQMEHTSERATSRREKLLHSLSSALLPHMYAEEQFFYQVLLDETSEQEHVYEALEEHRAAKMVLSDLTEAAVDDPRWPARLKVLKELVEHHVQEEEGQIFDIARTVIDEERAASAAKRFREMKKEAPAGAM
jgi:DUF438 domain-containing protein